MKKEQHKNSYIITGGPDSEKPTVLNALKQKGYAVMLEAGLGDHKTSNINRWASFTTKSVQCFAQARLT